MLCPAFCTLQMEERSLKNMIFWNKRKHKEPKRWLVAIAARGRRTVGYKARL